MVIKNLTNTALLWYYTILSYADVAELADALDLGSSAARRMGSTPFIRTILIIERAVRCAFTAACAVSLPRLNEGGFVV